MKIHTWHGFMYDPEDWPDNPQPFFDEMEELVGPNHKVIPHPYFSVPINLRNIIRANLNGHYGLGAACYRWAWELAKKEGDNFLDNYNRDWAAWKSAAIGHSLGTVPALYAAHVPDVKRVLLLSGAARTDYAYHIASNQPDTKFLNICVLEDDILKTVGSYVNGKFGRTDVIGRDGLSGKVLGNWCNIYLDDPDWQEWGRHFGWNLNGDSPTSWFDHKTSYENRDHWPLYRAFFNGDLDGQLFF